MIEIVAETGATASLVTPRVSAEPGGRALIRAEPGSHIVLSNPGSASAAMSAVLVLVHGLNSDNSAYGSFLSKVVSGEPLFERVGVLQLNWGNVELFNIDAWAQTVDELAENRDLLCAPIELRRLVQECRELLGPDVPIHVLSHSMGTLVTRAAIHQGLELENWVLMGSPIERDAAVGAGSTNFFTALERIGGRIVNLYSDDDSVVGGEFSLLHGIGCCAGVFDPFADCGLGEDFNCKCSQEGMCDIGIDNVGHGDWWDMDWLVQPGGSWCGPLDASDVLGLLTHGNDPRLMSSEEIEAFGELQEFAKRSPPGDDVFEACHLKPR
jgi:hypothetical protein